MLIESNEKIRCNCGYWIIAENDRFCGWCGTRFSGFTCSLSEDTVFLGGEDVGKKQITLQVSNTGRKPIKILEIDSSHGDILTIEEPPSSEKFSPIEPHGGAQEYVLYLDLITISNKYREIKVNVLSDLKGEEASQTLMLRLMPRPTFSLRSEELTLVLDGENLEENRVILELLEGRARIVDLQTDVEWAKVSVLDTDIPVDMDERQTRELKIQIIADEKMLIDLIGQGEVESDPVKLKLLVICQGMESSPLAFPVVIPTKMPAIFHIEETKHVLPGPDGQRLEFDVLLGGRKRFFQFQINIENRGDMPLTIKNLQVPEKPDWLELIEHPQLRDPITLGEKRDIQLKVDSNNFKEHNTELTLIIECDDPKMENGLANIPIVLKGRVLKDYKGIVAFDFGTTNTCIAVCNPQEKVYTPKVLKIDELKSNNSNTSIPTVIFYRNQLGDNQRLCDVGIQARARLPEDDTHQSIIQSIKRRIGQSEPISVRFYDNLSLTSDLSTEEISADIINEILTELEVYLQAKVNTCVISHPVQYIQRRLEALETAFAKANVMIDDRLSEPFAAALDFILTDTEMENNYKLMVWDFGGGTTDMAYLQVNIESDESGDKKVSTELLGADGLRNFGGDDITERIMKYFVEQCESAFSEEKMSDIKLYVDMDEIRSLRDFNIRQRAISNYYDLFDLAEKAKIGISDTSEPSAATRLTLRYWQNGRQGDFLTPELSLTLEKLEELAGPLIDDAILYMVDLIERNDNQFPDIVLLAGNSSRLPIVWNRMEVYFGNQGSRIVAAGSREKGENDRLKESVVIGLCQYYLSKVAPAAEILEELKVEPKATSNFGILKFKGGSLMFDPVIKKGDKLNKWYSVNRVRIKRDARPNIMSCSGRNFELENNPLMEAIASFPFEELPEEYTDDELSKAKLFMKVTDEEVTFKVNDQKFSSALPTDIF